MIAAIVPAAGSSRRMGQPKLVLPIDGRAVITRVIQTLRAAEVAPIVVVTPPTASPASQTIHDEALASGATDVLTPTAQPSDMRASVELALSHLAQLDPGPTAVLLVPADSPSLSPGIIRRLLSEAMDDMTGILVPTCGGRRGHPTLIPWSIAREIPGLPLDVGVNALVARHAASVREIPVEEPGVLVDLDTPADYERLTGHRLDGPSLHPLTGESSA